QSLGATARSLKIELLLVLRFASTHLRQGLCPLADSVGNDLLRLLPLGRRSIDHRKGAVIPPNGLTVHQTQGGNGGLPIRRIQELLTGDGQAGTQERNRWILVHKSPLGMGNPVPGVEHAHSPLYGLTTPSLAEFLPGQRREGVGQRLGPRLHI